MKKERLILAHRLTAQYQATRPLPNEITPNHQSTRPLFALEVEDAALHVLLDLAAASQMRPRLQ